MSEVTVFFDTYWWLIPLAVMVFCYFTMRGGGICSRMREEDPVGKSAREILNRRLASGEIGAAEYEEMARIMGLREGQ